MVRPRLLTILCYGAMMSLAIGVNLLPVFLTSFSASFGGANGLSQEQLGRLGAFSFAGLVFGIVLAGPLADRWGAKVFAIAGNAVMAASLVAMSIAPDYWALSIAVFWLGCGAGILDMVLSPVVSVLNPERRSAAMNWLHSFYCVGAVVTILASTVAGSLGARVNPFVVLAWCCGSSVLLFLLGSFLMVPGWALTACIVVGFTGSALWPTVLAVSADRYPAGGATMFAALAAMGNAGGILMPWIVGWIGDLVNLHWGLAVSTLAPLLMLLLVLLLNRTRAASSRL